MKKCSFCGEINPDSTDICPWCGRPDSNILLEELRKQTADPRTPKKASQKSNFRGQADHSLGKRKKNYKYSLVLAFLLFTIILFFLVINNLQSKGVAEGLVASSNIETQVNIITPKNTPTQLIVEHSGKIVFSSNRDLKDFDIFIISPDGKDQSKLTNNEFGNIYWDPSWSPDGRHIIFSCIPFGSETSEIFIMNSDGSNQTQITKNNNNDFEPVWSPDGSKIAFTSGFEEVHKIYLMNSDGSSQVRLTNDSKNERFPSWHLDGKSMIYSTNKGENNTFEIYSINIDGSDQKRLTFNDIDDVTPAWSPDGETIAYTSSQGGISDIYLMNKNGGEQVQLTFGRSKTTNYDPQWSPSGKAIVFTSNRDDGHRLNIYVMNSDGSNQTRITEYDRFIDSWEPSWLKEIEEDDNLNIEIEGTNINNVFPEPLLKCEESGTCIKQAIITLKGDLLIFEFEITNPEGETERGEVLKFMEEQLFGLSLFDDEKKDFLPIIFKSIQPGDVLYFQGEDVPWANGKYTKLFAFSVNVSDLETPVRAGDIVMVENAPIGFIQILTIEPEN